MRTRFLGSIIIAGLLGATLVPRAAGQSQAAILKARFDQLRTISSKLTPNHRVMSSSMAHQLRAAGMFDKLTAAVTSGKPFARKPFSHGIEGDNGTGVVSVNDRSTDLDFSGYDGITQSTSSTAMCGNQVVVGFNDYGSFMQTFINTAIVDPNSGTITVGPLSQTGAAVSSDGGKTFHDIGTINPGSDFTNFMMSDPVVTCSDPNTFYYTQVFGHGGFGIGIFGTFFSSISISKSADGGNTWGEPVLAADKELGFHSLDKPWSAIDPSNPQRIYVTYTDFDFSFSSPGCGFQTRTAIELVISNDGGQSFGSPIIVDEVCGDDKAVQASHVAFNSHGVAYVAWERLAMNTFDFFFNEWNPSSFSFIYNPDFPSGGAEIRVTHVAPDGTVAPSVFIEPRVLGGDTVVDEHGGIFVGGINVELDLQGQFHDYYGLDLAVDHSRGPNDGMVYVTWDDARNKSVPDLSAFQVDWTRPPFFIKDLLDAFPNAQINLPFLPLLLTNGNYLYTDVRLSKSADGLHFSPSVQVNSDQQPKVGGGHDHFQPAIATDSNGHVAICWYDRRNDPLNFKIERFCAKSANGSKWDNFRVPIAPFSPIHRLDFELFAPLGSFNLVDQSYMGDRDGLTTDLTGKNKGFIGAFQWMSSGMNPDVKSYKFD